MEGLFAYTKKDSAVHRTPALLKLIILFAVPVTLHFTPIWVCFALIPTFLLLALFAGIGAGRFFRDLRPIVIYSIMIISIDVMSWLLFHRYDEIITKTSLYLILRLLCAVEATSVFFRTTSIYEITDLLIRIPFGTVGLTVSGVLSLFLTFLPEVFATWSELETAYRARGGRKGFAKVVLLLPLLISLSINKARITYLALLNRS